MFNQVLINSNKFLPIKQSKPSICFVNYIISHSGKLLVDHFFWTYIDYVKWVSY